MKEQALAGGHPAGLKTLFFTEMWERFSFYGMKALLVLYLVAPAKQQGLALSDADAARIFGLYTSAVYFTNIFGGLLADRVLGARLAVLLGGIVIACGHFSLALQSVPLFYTGLVLIVLGTGLLKPNISTMVGSLYAAGDPRRDSGFSIFYMGINLGGMIAPLVCGYLGQRVGWHYGFAAAGVGMVLGLVQYVAQRRHLAHVGTRPQPRNDESHALRQPLTQAEKNNLALIFLLYFFSMLFWTAFEQGGSSFSLFADRHTRTQLFGWNFPSSWFQSINSFFILLLAPIFAWLWARLGPRQPSSHSKFSWGLLFVGVGMFVMAGAALLLEGGRVSPLWLVAVFFIHTVGELCLSPVGLSTVTKLAPARLVGLMMGLWFLASSIGNYCAGYAAGFYQDDRAVLLKLFSTLGLLTIGGAALLVLLRPLVERLARRNLPAGSGAFIA